MHGIFEVFMNTIEIMPFTYEYPRPALTVDAVVFKKENDNCFVLLIKRDNYPFEGQWAFPGGFVDMDENLENAVKRELAEETSIENIELRQLYTFGALDRDPRHRTVSVVYYAIVDKNTDLVKIKAADDARAVKWFNINEIPKLAFDHNEIFKKALLMLNE